MTYSVIDESSGDKYHNAILCPTKPQMEQVIRVFKEFSDLSGLSASVIDESIIDRLRNDYNGGILVEDDFYDLEMTPEILDFIANLNLTKVGNLRTNGLLATLNRITRRDRAEEYYSI